MTGSPSPRPHRQLCPPGPASPGGCRAASVSRHPHRPGPPGSPGGAGRAGRVGCVLAGGSVCSEHIPRGRGAGSRCAGAREPRGGCRSLQSRGPGRRPRVGSLRSPEGMLSPAPAPQAEAPPGRPLCGRGCLSIQSRSGPPATVLSSQPPTAQRPRGATAGSCPEEPERAPHTLASSGEPAVPVLRSMERQTAGSAHSTVNQPTEEGHPALAGVAQWTER